MKKYLFVSAGGNSGFGFEREVEIEGLNLDSELLALANEHGHCQGGEKIYLQDVETGEELAMVEWSPEDGGHYYICEM